VGKNSKRWEKRYPNVGHLYPPRTPYFELFKNTSPPIKDSWITFKADLPELHKLVSKKTSFASFIDSSGELMHLIDDIVLLARDYGEKAFWLAQSQFMKILNLLFSSQKIGEGKYKILKGSFQKQYSKDVARAMNLLNQNFTTSLTLDDIAKQVNISKSTLCHKFQKETLLSPMAVRMHCKIEAAKGLLLKGEPLKVIAEHMGFCDPFHLSKRFKQIEGVSPKKFLSSG
jgi:AraC-like DNA-binding protein